MKSNQAETDQYLIAAYMAASINYGKAATPELSEIVGSILTGLSVDDFYESICRIADRIGLEKYRDAVK